MQAVDTPLVVALVGLPGAGKSVVAHHLVRELGLRLVSRDAIRAAMFPDCRYTITEKRGAFRAVLTALEVNAALGASSVVDGMTFAKRSDLDRVADTCARSGARLLALWLDVPPHVARARVAADAARGTHTAADRDAALVDRVLREFEAPGNDVVPVDASGDAASVGAAALAVVSAALAPRGRT